MWVLQPQGPASGYWPSHLLAAWSWLTLLPPLCLIWEMERVLQYQLYCDVMRLKESLRSVQVQGVRKGSGCRLTPPLCSQEEPVLQTGWLGKFTNGTTCKDARARPGWPCSLRLRHVQTFLGAAELCVHHRPWASPSFLRFRPHRVRGGVLLVRHQL